jgi:hypothetical protein
MRRPFKIKIVFSKILIGNVCIGPAQIIAGQTRVDKITWVGKKMNYPKIFSGPKSSAALKKSLLSHGLVLKKKSAQTLSWAIGLHILNSHL